MTAEERAAKTVQEWLASDHRFTCGMGGQELMDDITKAITAAVEAEREACAKVAEDWLNAGSGKRDTITAGVAVQFIARAIRARGDG